VVTIRAAKWSLYVPHSGHYTYRNVVTIRTAQWSLYVPHSGYYTYRTVVTIRTTSCNIQQFYVLPTQLYLRVLCGSQTAIISLYSIDELVCITDTECVYCAVRTGSLYTTLRSVHTAVFMCFVWI